MWDLSIFLQRIISLPLMWFQLFLFWEQSKDCLYKSWQINVEAGAMKMHREFEKNSVKAGLQGFVFGKKLLFDVDTFWMLNWNISARTLCCGSTLSTTISLNFKDANKKCKTLCKRCILELLLKLTDVCLSKLKLKLESAVEFDFTFTDTWEANIC